MTKVRQALGQWGEELAAKYLVEQGMVLLDRNWRTSAGEIDIVARDVNVLVFCEQKFHDLRQDNLHFRLHTFRHRALHRSKVLDPLPDAPNHP